MTLLAWDTDFFGFKVARLDPGKLAPDGLEPALARLAVQGVRLAYLAVPPGDAAMNETARACGGFLVNQRAELSHDLAALDSNTECVAIKRPIAPADEARLIELAWASAEQSRFRLDQRLPQDAWRRLYEIWMRRSLAGELADAVLTHRSEGRIVGMITLSASGRRGEIGLFAVDGSVRGQGIGSRLLGGALNWFRSERCTNAHVVTQGENEAALAIYRHAGFRLARLLNVYHIWIESP